MHHVVFVTYPGFELLDLSGPVAVFNGANRALSERDAATFYALHIASAAGGPIESSSGIVVQTAAIGDIRPRAAQTMLVTGAERAPLLAAMADPALTAGVSRLVAGAERFGAVCSGGFVLAAMGLLDGRRVATHWDACAPMTQGFPGVTVDPDALYVTDGPCWTSAGVTTGIDMALAMVSTDLDAAIAGEVAKRLVLYARRPGHQSQFSPVLQAQTQADSPFSGLIAWIQANLDARLDVPALAERAALSERSFHRKFTAATGITPARYVETARLDMARMLLSRGVAIKSVAAQVGLSPAAHFSTVFERRFGIAPRLFSQMHAGM